MIALRPDLMPSCIVPTVRVKNLGSFHRLPYTLILSIQCMLNPKEIFYLATTSRDWRILSRTSLIHCPIPLIRHLVNRILSQMSINCRKEMEEITVRSVIFSPRGPVSQLENYKRTMEFLYGSSQQTLHSILHRLQQVSTQQSFFIPFKSLIIEVLSSELNCLETTVPHNENFLSPKHLLTCLHFPSSSLPQGWEDTLSLSFVCYVNKLVRKIDAMPHLTLEDVDEVFLSLINQCFKFQRPDIGERLFSRIQREDTKKIYKIYKLFSEGHFEKTFLEAVALPEDQKNFFIRVLIKAIAERTSHEFALHLAQRINNPPLQIYIVNQLIIDSFDIHFPEKSIHFIFQLESQSERTELLHLIIDFLTQKGGDEDKIYQAMQLYPILTSFDQQLSLPRIIHALLRTCQWKKIETYVKKFDDKKQIQMFNNKRSERITQKQQCLLELENMPETDNMIIEFRRVQNLRVNGTQIDDGLRGYLVKMFTKKFIKKFNLFFVLTHTSTDLINGDTRLVISLCALKYSIQKIGIKKTLVEIEKMPEEHLKSPIFFTMISLLTSKRMESKAPIELSLSLLKRVAEPFALNAALFIIRALVRRKEWRRAIELLPLVEEYERYDNIRSFVEEQAQKKLQRRTDQKCIVC